jgi:hypothetical protein
VFFSYPWWITFYNLGVLLLAAASLGGFLHRFRPGIIALLAISLMQNLSTANTFLYYDSVPTTSGTFEARARVTSAGAIIKSIAMFFLIGLIGARDESSTHYDKPGKKTGGGGGGIAAMFGGGKGGKAPHGERVTAAEAGGPRGGPGANVSTEPQIVGVRRGEATGVYATPAEQRPAVLSSAV